MAVHDRLASVIRCDMCRNTATRAIRARLPWCRALRSMLVPLAVLAKLTWCATIVGKRDTLSAIAGCCTGSRNPQTVHLQRHLSTLPHHPGVSSQKTDAWQFPNVWQERETQ